MKPAIAPQPPVLTHDVSNANRRRSAAARRGVLITESTATGDSSAPIWEPTPPAANTIPTSSQVLHTPAPNGTIGPVIENALIAIITRPIGDHETHQTGNDNRERELRCYLASLSPIEAFALRKRLDANRDDDAVAVAFRRLLAERRQRLRAFLADPRRGRV